MSIKKRLQLASVLLVVMYVVLGSAVFLGYRYVAKQASIAIALENQATFLQMILRGVNEVIVTEGTPQSVEIVELGIKGFNGIHTKLLSNSNNTNYYNVYTEKIKPEWQEIIVKSQPFLEHHLDVEDDKLLIEYGRLITKTDKLIEEINKLSITTRTTIDANSKTTKLIQYIMLAVLLLSTMFILSTLVKHYRSIISPIKDLNEISEGFEHGDLSLSMNDSRKDEFGILASHFNRATAKLNNMISKVKEVAGTLAVNTEKVSESSLQISKNALEQSSQTDQTASAMEELNSSFLEVTKNTLEAAESSKDASELALQGGAVVEKTIHGMDKISASVHDSTQIIEGLGSRSEEIGDIIKVINDIAGQTNLLALNAAIEAARAGEQGRGFSVVADEVRKLAERTTSATGDIGEMIKGIQEDTHKAIESMHVGTTEVTEGVNLANQAGETLQQIVASVQKVTDMIQHIAIAAEEQSTTGEEISATIESVANLTKVTSDSAQESSNATQQLTGLAQQLQHLVNEFILKNDVNRISSIRQEVKIEKETKDQPIHSV